MITKNSIWHDMKTHSHLLEIHNKYYVNYVDKKRKKEDKNYRYTIGPGIWYGLYFISGIDGSRIDNPISFMWVPND